MTQTSLVTNQVVAGCEKLLFAALLDQIIKLLQLLLNQVRLLLVKNILHLETDKNSFLLNYKLKNEQKDTTKVSFEKFRSFSFLSFFPSLLFLFVYFFKAV